MESIRGLKEDQWGGMEGKIDFPLFDKEIRISIEEDVPMEYAERCAEFLRNIGGALVEKLCEGSIRYCEHMRQCVDLEEEGIEIPEGIKGRDVLAYIRPCSLIVAEPKDERVAFHMELNCDWEPEHGMEWTVMDGEAMYVGAFNCESPWRRDRQGFKEIGWNYAVLD